MNLQNLFAAGLKGRRLRRFNAQVAQGDAARAARDWKRAATHYGTALEIDPSSFPIRIQFGHALKEQGLVGDAESAYRTAIGFNTKDADAYLQLGHALKLQGKYNDAFEAYATATRIDPSLVDAQRELKNISGHVTVASSGAILGQTTPHQSLHEVIANTIEGLVRQELEPGFSGPSLFAGVLEGLWERFEQLQANQQGIIEYIRSQSSTVTSGAGENKLDELTDHFFGGIEATSLRLGRIEQDLHDVKATISRLADMERRAEAILALPEQMSESLWDSFEQLRTHQLGLMEALQSHASQAQAKYEKIASRLSLSETAVESLKELRNLTTELVEWRSSTEGKIEKLLIFPEEVAESIRQYASRIESIAAKTAELSAMPGQLDALHQRISDDIAPRLEATETNKRSDTSLTERMDEIAAIAERLTLEVARRDELEKVQARGEFIRSELMYEFRAALTNNPKTAAIVPRIIDATKVSQAISWQRLRVNVGCGHLPVDEYVNVDSRELPGVDVIAEATNLPFDDASISEIYAAHLLEHFPEEIIRRTVLPHWRKKIRADGLLRLVVPDAEAMIKDYVAGKMPFDDLRKVTFGGQDYQGDFHYTMFTSEYLFGLLSELGFVDLKLVAAARVNGLCREMEIVGVRAK